MMVMCGYGYAAVSTDLLISGDATVVPGTAKFSAQYMQDLTPTECANAEPRTTSQMIDKRDGRKYWVAKVGSYCLMTQDLKYDLVPDANGRIELTSELSDINYSSVAGYEEEQKNGKTIYKWNENSNYPPSETEYVARNWGTNVNTTYSMNFGEYVPHYIYPTSAKDCAQNRVGPSACPAQGLAVGEVWEENDNGEMIKTENAFSPTLSYLETGEIYDESARTYDAHFLFGNYYQYMTATAGSGPKTSNGVATSSICPKGWKLPNATNNEYLNGTEEDAEIFGTTGAQSFFLEPTFAVQGGRYIGNYFSEYGKYGYLRTNTFASSTNTNVISNVIMGSRNIARYGAHIGLQMRCVLREEEEE